MCGTFDGDVEVAQVVFEWDGLNAWRRVAHQALRFLALELTFAMTIVSFYLQDSLGKRSRHDEKSSILHDYACQKFKEMYRMKLVMMDAALGS